MDRLNAMRVFVTVVDLGSQSAAADHLQLSRPVVSRYLAELEDWVGARLMQRTTRKLSLTAAGQQTLPRCRQLLELAGDLQAAVRQPDDAPRGELRISVSTSFGQAQLVDAVADYVRRYPGVRVELQMLDRTVNLVDERIDLAIRTSNDLDPNLIARRLTVCRSVVCAAPKYLAEHGMPQQVEELSQHNCLTHAYFGHSLWQFEVGGRHVAVPVQGNISANEAMTLQKAALAGAGIAMLPTYQAAGALRSGELVRLLPEARPRELNLNAVYTSRKHMPATLRSMLDFLAQRFTDEPQWDEDL
ncbi:MULTISPECIES: LysR family transcriptional regulator [Pseudomonas]|uniref:LysR family transcriptional regulator n=1 Tax=Pseudomonas guariconensis TaxID=1288410 RepID=A0AAX0VXE5_9PSED|nr:MULTISPECIES: LysR family transcriptional regulator [Pseudomonas]MDM9595624.1 LysR family transcriptional regulator [Pseudomonas guariconensis]MDM9608454.1 LysR family transcriptional regulator [Pseudomonas guariconensis]MDM9613411.1 LysR family transcriptional regulator [Pseudomonas guariconensis]PLV18705.1 LysR family transcriptional regulator [Pseudomonas guariconensis]PLV23822.1 LysR family transcriptional regulator [Pseudomonas guariconensis]